jgi:hypothetical protein
MTNVSRRYVISDAETIAQAITDLSAHRGYEWECWHAHREVAAWDEVAHPHESAELFHANRRLVSVCDAAVVHAHENGSTALGYLYRALIEAPHHPPALVVPHITERLSKAWEGQRNHHLAVTFKRFDGDDLGSLELRQVTYDWLEQNADAINDGPARRRDVEHAFGAQSDALVASWQRLGRDTHRDVAERLMLPETAVRDLITNPIELASLTSYDFMVLLQLVDAEAARFVAEEPHDCGQQIWSLSDQRCVGRLRAFAIRRHAERFAPRRSQWSRPKSQQRKNRPARFELPTEGTVRGSGRSCSLPSTTARIALRQQLPNS